MATNQAKAVLASVKLVIDLEAQKVNTSTEDLEPIEMPTKAKESVLLTVKLKDDYTDKQDDFIRYPRDLLVRLQHHPFASHRPTGISDAEVVRKCLNRKAFHASPQRIQPPENCVNYVNPVTQKTKRLYKTFRHIRGHINKGMPISRSQLIGVLMLIKEYKALFLMIEDNLEPVEKLVYQCAVSNMEVIHKPRTSQFNSDNALSGFVSRILSLCTNAHEFPLPEGVSVPAIVPGRMSISKAGRQITLQRVTVNVVLGDDGDRLAVCWTPSDVSKKMCYLSLTDQPGESKGTIPTELVKRSTQLQCNLVMSVSGDEKDALKNKLTASLQYASPELPAMQTNMNMPWLDRENTVSFTPWLDRQSSLIAKIVFALSLHQLENIHYSLQKALPPTNHTLNKFLKLIQVHCNLITHCKEGKDTVLDDLNPLSIQYLVDSSANKDFLRSKLIDQVIIKTNNTIMVREKFCDELVKVHLFKYGIQNHKICSNVHMNPLPQASVQINRSMKENLEDRKYDVKSSLCDEEKGAEKLNHEEDTFDHLEDDDCPVLSTLGEILTVEQEDSPKQFLMETSRRDDEYKKKRESYSSSSYTDGAKYLVEPSPELIVAMIFQKTQEGVTTLNGIKYKHHILFKVSANKDTNLIMHGVSIFMQEKIREVIIDECKKDDHGTYWVFSADKYTDVTPDRKMVLKLLYKRPITLSKAKYYLLIGRLSGGSSGVVGPLWARSGPKTLE